MNPTKPNISKFSSIIAVIVVVLLALGFIKDLVIKSIVTNVAGQVAGAKVDIGSLSVGVFRHAVSIKNFKMYNPPGFPREVMLDIPEMAVEYDLFSILKGKLHLALIVFDLKEMTVIKNKDGKLNVDALKVAQKDTAAEGKPGKSKAGKKEPAKQMLMQIDEMRLNIGQVIFKDFSQSDTPVVSVYDVGIKQKTFKNITSAQQLITLVLIEALKPTAIKNAQIYAAAAILGVGFLPAGIVGMVVGNKAATAEYNVSSKAAFSAVEDLLKKLGGEIKVSDEAGGSIKAKVSGNDVVVTITSLSRGKTKVEVLARKILLPQQQFAEGIIYQLNERLK